MKRGQCPWCRALASLLVFLCNSLTFICLVLDSLIAQLVKNLPVVQETWVRFLGQEDALQKEMAAHSNILAWPG